MVRPRISVGSVGDGGACATGPAAVEGASGTGIGAISGPGRAAAGGAGAGLAHPARRARRRTTTMLLRATSILGWRIGPGRWQTAA